MGSKTESSESEKAKKKVGAKNYIYHRRGIPERTFVVTIVIFMEQQCKLQLKNSFLWVLLLSSVTVDTDLQLWPTPTTPHPHPHFMLLTGSVGRSLPVLPDIGWGRRIPPHFCLDAAENRGIANPRWQEECEIEMEKWFLNRISALPHPRINHFLSLNTLQWKIFISSDLAYHTLPWLRIKILTPNNKD